MARQQRREAHQDSPAEGAGTPSSAEERKGKRGHDESGNVRPADGRWELHEPKDESKYVRTDKAEES
jgi:hypothetical protein